jgi:hypothetical protein
MYLRTAWNDYFTGSTTPLQSKDYGERQTPSSTGVYFSNCLFRSISSGSNGGALYCSSSVTYLLVESTSFISCKTSSINGGAIYFYNSGGECVLHEVCGYDCYSTYTSGTSQGQFAYINVYNAASSKNYLNYSSIVRCVNENSNSDHMMRFYNGKICCPSVNISMNKCQWYTGITCNPLKDSNSITCSLTYSSFADNIANYCNCILLYTTGAQYEIKSCNILRNKQVTPNADGTIWTCGTTMIEDSCFLENNATRIFHQGNSNYRITLTNCTVDSTSSNGYLTITNTVTKSFIHALNHMSTLNCHSKYDSVGTLTPITPPAPSKKQIHCFTFGNHFNQCQIIGFVSLLSVFLFNFIHLDASIYPLY